MLWPFVSRRAFDAVTEQLARCHAIHEGHAVRLLENAKADLDRADARYADLMASYRMLRLQGAVEAPPPRVPEKPPEVDPVEAAIRVACAGKDASVYKAMRAKAAQMRTQSATDDQIIASIQRGSRPAEELEAV